MKKTVISTLALFLTVPVLTSCSSQEQVAMKLKTNELIIEYGSLIDTNVATYLDNDKDVVKDVIMSGLPENETGKDYPSIGEYEISLSYKDQTDKVKVIVKDTVAPVFNDIKDKYEISLDKQLNVDGIKATDLSDVTITLDDAKVDYKKVGEYKATVLARDTSGNETKKEITVVVKDEEKTETSSTKPSTSSSSSNNGTSTKSSTGTSTSTSSSSKPASTKPNSSGSSTSSVSSTTTASTSKPNTSTSTGSSSSESASSTTGNTTKPEEPKPTPKPDPAPTWAMTEAEMIAYAKECVTSFKPTSGYGTSEWYDGFNKNNSGWFAPVTINIKEDASGIKYLINGSVRSTLRKSTSQIADDGDGNIRTDAKYYAKVYFEKESDNAYKVYVFYGGANI